MSAAYGTSAASAQEFSAGTAHLAALRQALDRFGDQLGVAERWGRSLAGALTGGSRLLAVGNGGSAAQAQHFTAELVGRYAMSRAPFSAIALHSEASALTAILNDFGPAEVFARQVAAHGRPGDVLVAMSTSGRSGNILAAVARAREIGLTTWAMTGPAPNPLADACEEALAVQAAETATVQEVHLVALHLVCAALDEELLADAAIGAAR